MRKTILYLFLTLLAAYPAFSQSGRMFYSVCRTENSLPDTNAQTDKLNVENFSDDSITFVPETKINYAIKKVANQNFLARYDDGSRNDFYIYKPDDNSFYMLSMNNLSWAYYNTDQKLSYEKDNNKRCGVALDTIDKFAAAVRLYKKQPKAPEQPKAPDPVAAAHTKALVTDFVKNYQSKRNDPALNKDILRWWENNTEDAASFPIQRIYILAFDLVRNDYGIVTNKAIEAMYVYKSKKSSLCFAEWYRFAYDALGGGTFDTQIKQWPTYDTYQKLSDQEVMFGGRSYEVDCTAVQTKPTR